MSLLNDASLVFIPSGYKEDKVYSIIPSDGSGDLDFVRGSDGTRINSLGQVENVCWNAIKYSEDFTNAVWGIPNGGSTVIVTSNATAAPNGTPTADKIEIASGSFDRIEQVNTGAILTTGLPCTFSCYIKSVGGTGNVGVRSGQSGVSSVLSYTSEWQRLTWTFNAAATYEVPQLCNNTLVSGADAAPTFYIWGAQLNIGSTAKPYFPTTDRLNVPRLTYENGCPSLLLEKQSTNLATYSEDFNNAGWTGFNSTVTANTTISPDGTQNADTVVYGSSGYLYQQISIVSWSSVTISIFSKTNSQCIIFGGATPSGTDTFTTIAYANGWYRQILTRVFTSPATGIVQFLPFGNNTTLYLWGAQIEQSSYPTSYIKTTSTSVTRLADSCYKTGISSLIGQTEGTLFAEITTQASPANNWFQITDGTANNWIFIGLNTNKLVCYIRAGAVTYIFNQSFTFTDGVSCRMALGYKSGDCAFYINGSEIATTQATFSISAPFNRVVFGDLLNPPNDSAKYGQALLFKRRLTNTELAQLTTI